ncbi:MAG TPA: type II CAAX endopeptidase family protein, partial [Candidatus Sulfotelmatobacter sp.]|nr:type II CAAX endopeptidase family protein [Candidatus Sulfotelmatobacter sp.]
WPWLCTISAMPAQETPRSSGAYIPIASRRHFVVMLLIQAALVAIGFWLQSRSGSDSILPQSRNVLPLYLSVIALEWGLVATVRGAANERGISLWQIIGEHWKSWKNIVLDIAICVPFVFAWEMTARFMHRLLGPDQAKSIGSLLPQSTLEVLLWIVVSISAGICEEIIFRGYFQRQFAAYTSSMTAGVLLQALVFGLGHSYQGVKQVVIISVLGLLYGALAAWRRNLGSNMIAHAWTDIWNGWLSGVVR